MELVVVTEPVVMLEVVITKAVLTVAVELVPAMHATMYSTVPPTVEAASRTASLGECHRAEQQGEHEPECGTKR